MSISRIDHGSVTEQERVDALLAQLEAGDLEAVERIFRESEPQLRNAVRRQMKDVVRRFDSTDIVQSVWVGVLAGLRKEKWRFKDATHLRAFLHRATRNRLIDRLRQQGTARRHQQSIGGDILQGMPDGDLNRPSEMAQAEELWQQMLNACPPEHHQLLQMKRQGLTLDEIARNTGLHKSSVRRILYAVARRVSTRSKSPR